jgi:hypothetical protein
VGLFDYAVGVLRSLRDGADGALEDLSFAAQHNRMVGGSADSEAPEGHSRRPLYRVVNGMPAWAVYLGHVDRSPRR